MRISAPCQITSRLLPGVQVGDGTISIEYAYLLHNAAIDGGRTRYRWIIDIPAGEFTGDDLRSGVGGGSLQSGLESLLTFLSACGESFSYGERRGLTTKEIMEQTENASLFPVEVAEWAAANRDELSMLAYELENASEPVIAE